MLCVLVVFNRIFRMLYIIFHRVGACYICVFAIFLFSRSVVWVVSVVFSVAWVVSFVFSVAWVVSSFFESHEKCANNWKKKTTKTHEVNSHNWRKTSADLRCISIWWSTKHVQKRKFKKFSMKYRLSIYTKWAPIYTLYKDSSTLILK